MREWLIGAAVVACLALVAAPASSSRAQDPAASRESSVQRLPDIVVYGRRQEPGALYVLSRSGEHYEVRDIRTTFVQEVVRSVGEGPF